MRWYTRASGKREREVERVCVYVCRRTPNSDPIPHLQGINKHVCVSAPVDYNQREKGNQIYSAAVINISGLLL